MSSRVPPPSKDPNFWSQILFPFVSSVGPWMSIGLELKEKDRGHLKERQWVVDAPESPGVSSSIPCHSFISIQIQRLGEILKTYFVFRFLSLLWSLADGLLCWEKVSKTTGQQRWKISSPAVLIRGLFPSINSTRWSLIRILKCK